MDDLVEACNQALYEFSGIHDGVRRRQVFDDLLFMESEQGWSIPLQRIKEGRHTYYRYEDPNFSIKDKGLNATEAEQLKDTLTILARFQGLPNFEWMDEVQVRLKETFHLTSSRVENAVSFQHNPYLTGLNHFSTLFSAIQNNQVLQITYQSFKKPAPDYFEIHPYHLKQYNNRWFLFGWNSVYEQLTNLPLDRITNIKSLALPFIPNTSIDFSTYFEDVVGVTVYADVPTEQVILKVTLLTWPYLETKPLHESQKVLERTEEYIRIQLEVQINHELKSLLFSYMDALEIESPSSLRTGFQSIAQNIFQKHT